MQNFLRVAQNITWKNVVAALFALGIVSTADPKLAAISVAAMLLVLLLNALVRTWKIKIGAAWLSIALYVVSLLLAFMFDPSLLAGWPVYAGDPAQFAAGLVQFMEGMAPTAGVLVTSGTLIYNILKPLVFDQLLPSLDDALATPEMIG